MKRSKLIIFFVLQLLLVFTVNISANELNLEIQHEDEPSDKIVDDLANENNLLPPLIKDKSNKNLSIKGNVLITEEIIKTREVDGAEITVKLKTDNKD